MAPLPATEGTSMAVTRATDPGKAKDVSRLRYVPNMRNKRTEGGYIANITACLANVLHTQFSCWISDNWCQRRYLSIWPYTCSRPHRPSISAWYELADGDLSQNVPVKRNPLLLQNMIHPTPHKSAALFLSYEPSVTHVTSCLPRSMKGCACIVGCCLCFPTSMSLPMCRGIPRNLLVEADLWQMGHLRSACSLLYLCRL
jgi:hypothetical protein